MVAEEVSAPEGPGPDLSAVRRWVERTCSAQDVPVAVCGDDTIRRVATLLGATPVVSGPHVAASDRSAPIALTEEGIGAVAAGGGR